MKKILGVAVLAVALWLGLGLFFPSRFFPSAWLENTQLKNLEAVRAHIEKISPEWESFRAQHPVYKNVELYGYTGGDGMFGANGDLESEEDVQRLRRFMEESKPPRPVYVGAVRIGGLKGGGSQPARKVESH